MDIEILNSYFVAVNKWIFKVISQIPVLSKEQYLYQLVWVLSRDLASKKTSYISIYLKSVFETIFLYL